MDDFKFKIMSKFCSLFFLLTILLISQLNVRSAQDETLSENPKQGSDEGSDEATNDKNSDKILQSSNILEPEEIKKPDEQNQPEIKKLDDSPINKKGYFTSDELHKKFERIKTNKKANFKGKSGKVFQVVSETIKEVNPVRFIQQVDPGPVFAHTGFNVDKFNIPVNYLSKAFYDRLAERTKKSQKELSNLLGVDIMERKDGEFLNIGKLLKIGKENNLKLGDYIYCFGINNMKNYENSYDEHLIELVRVPVEFIDEVATETLHNYLHLFKEYVSKSGGALNAGLLYYDEITGRDIITDAKKMINDMKNSYNSKTTQKQRELYEKQLEEYKKQVVKRFEFLYNEWFGKGGKYFVYKTKLVDKINVINGVIHKFTNEETIKDYSEIIENIIGPQGKAILYIIYTPTIVMINQIFGPFTIIPRIFHFGGDDIYEKILAMPPVIIQTTGELFKPLLMVVEPLIRLLRFVSTGEYSSSISTGLDLAASYGISIWGGAYKPKHSETAIKKRVKRNLLSYFKKTLKNKTRHIKKTYSLDESSQYSKNDRRMIDAYQGGPPPGGYKLVVKNENKINFEDENLVSRILLSPYFLLKVGGPMYVPLVSVLAPILRVANKLLFGKEEFMKRIGEVPSILRGVGMVGQFADIIENILPVIKIAHLSQTGQLTSSQALVQAPTLVKILISGPVYHAYRNPHKLLNNMLNWLEGSGGIISVLKLQEFTDLPKADNVAIVAEKEIETETFLGDLFGGWFIEYIKALLPVLSIQTTFFNGLIGNVINPVKFLNQSVDLKIQPLKNILKAFDDLSLMYKSCADKNSFLTAVLGGNNPNSLKEIGINADKMVDNGIDVGILLAGGAKMLDEIPRKMLETEPDKYIETSLPKIGLDSKKILEHGLLEANEHKLIEANIDINLLYNRVLMGSLEDESRLSSSGINITVMLKAGIWPATFLVGGINTIPDEKLKELGIKNVSQLTKDNMKELGFNPLKLSAKGIQAKSLAQDGLESFSHVTGNLGLNLNLLLMSVYSGMNPNKLKSAGIDIKTVVKSRIDTKLLLIGGFKKHLKSDISKENLLKLGIDSKQITTLGINTNIIVDLGISVVNPISLVRIGIDPMASSIALLSRHGLQKMTGGVDDVVSLLLGFINSMLHIANNIFDLIAKIRLTQNGKNILDENGKFIGPAAILAYKIIELDEHGGILGMIQKIVSQKFTTAEVLQMIDIQRIVFALAFPNQKKTSEKKRIKEHHIKEEYLIKSYHSIVSQSHKEGKNNLTENSEGIISTNSSLIAKPATISSGITKFYGKK